MPNVTRSEFREWERNPVTVAVKEAVLKRIEEVRDQLEGFGAENYHYFLQGLARGYRDLLDVEPEISVDDIEEAE